MLLLQSLPNLYLRFDISFLSIFFRSIQMAVLLIGESGTAKTVTIQQYIKKQPADIVKNKQIALSSATSANILQRSLESSVDKRLGNAYGPPMGTRLIMFIDDINMPEYVCFV